MIFTSFTFLWFMVVVFAGYWLVRRHHRLQNFLLLVASYVFYGWVHPWFLILLAGSTVFDWACALAMDRWPRRRREWLIGSLIANLGLLGTFKYLGFFVESWEAALRALGMNPRPIELRHLSAGRHLVLRPATRRGCAVLDYVGWITGGSAQSVEDSMPLLVARR